MDQSVVIDESWEGGGYVVVGRTPSGAGEQRIALSQIPHVIKAQLDDIDELRDRRKELRDELASKRAVLGMTVARLGGMVEGRPTQQLNFLQRVDELRELERRLGELKGACEPAEHHACLTGDCPHEDVNDCIKSLTAWAAAIGKVLAVVRVLMP